MKQAAFAPGFRLSVVDVFVLFGGTISAIVLSMYVWWWGFIPAFVLAHFFSVLQHGADFSAARIDMGWSLYLLGRHHDFV